MTITPDDARHLLNDAHSGMTDDEISEHACCLAAVVASQDALIRVLLDDISCLSGELEAERKVCSDVAILIRQTASLQASHKKAAARELIRKLAASVGPLVGPEKVHCVDRSLFVAVGEAWPDVFTPKGSLS